MNKVINRLTRKTINDKRFLGDFQVENENQELPKPIMKKIITSPEYITNGEILIVVKDTDTCNITLDNNTTEHIIIKALTKVFIRPSYGKIDEFYDEILIDWGACVEFYLLEDNWFIVSSDGLKLE